MANEIVRVRIAPSPTGKFHIGTARTALFNYLFARKNEGKFIVRIEDTDTSRNSESYTKDILEGLKWLGLLWDEGPEIGGPFGPYFQHERLTLYRDQVQKLIKSGYAYHCYCTQEELEREKLAQQKKGLAPKYSGRCRNLTEKQISEFERQKRPSVIRFKVDESLGEISFEDLIRGNVSFDSALIGDFVIVRSDGNPLFVFSNVVDDALMKISHVLRGEEHLANVPKQILLYDALDFLPPLFGHFPLIFNKDRSKMSKRKDPVSITDDYRAKGYYPHAVLNYIALLGWASGTDRELYSMRELISEFTLERVGKSPSIFDQEKLLWMNGYYLRNLEIGELAEAAKPFINNEQILLAIEKEPYYFLQALGLIKDRLKLLSEAEEQLKFFFIEPDYDPSLLIVKNSTLEKTLKALETAITVLEPLANFHADELEIALRRAAKDNGLSDGEMLWSVRAALSGLSASPGAFEILEVLGKERSLQRIKKAKENLAQLKNK